MQQDFDPKVVHEYELETWMRCADGYMDGFAGMTSETIPMLIDGAGIKQGDRVLDIGSGPGHVAAFLSGQGCSVSGIDFSESMVETAQSLFSEIEFLQANAEEIPFEDDEFDAVISNFVVHHLANPETVFGEVSRVLKPGARFAFTVFADPAAQSSIGAFFAAVEEHFELDEMPHGPLFGVTDLEMYEEMLGRCGMEDAKFGFHDFAWRTDSTDPVIDSFIAWGNISALPDEIRQKIVSSTRKNLEQFREGDGFVLPHKALSVNAASRSH